MWAGWGRVGGGVRGPAGPDSFGVGGGVEG